MHRMAMTIHLALQGPCAGTEAAVDVRGVDSLNPLPTVRCLDMLTEGGPFKGRGVLLTVSRTPVACPSLPSA